MVPEMKARYRNLKTALFDSYYELSNELVSECDESRNILKGVLSAILFDKNNLDEFLTKKKE
jgi:hypothetical protein